MEGWRDIKSAPKDGIRILLGFQFCQNFDVVAHYIADDWRLSGFSSTLAGRPKPTHWMPLPIAPGLEGAKYAE